MTRTNKTSFASLARSSAKAAAPVVLGYVSIGLPCGVMGAAVGMAPWMCLLLSCTFYSGAGQFMIPSMWAVGSPAAAIAASVSMVSARQALYSAAFAPYTRGTSKLRTIFFALFVTDESFGVNLDLFARGEGWDVRHATLTNMLCMFSWALANFVGAIVGGVVELPVDILSFGMTAIFVCLLACQKASRANLVAVAGAVVGVLACKLAGLSSMAILLGAIVGVLAGLAYEGVEQE